MYKRRFNTKPVYVADPDEHELESKPELVSEAGPASPSSCEDTKIEEPSPKKRFLLFFPFILKFFIFFFGFVNLEVKVVNR
jgi:hypothetical protein